MAVLLIDKIMPKNDAFVGLVDADQVIGLSGFVASGMVPTSGAVTFLNIPTSGIATSGHVAQFTGSGLTVFESTVNEFSTDGTLLDNSDFAVPTEQAVRTYVDVKASGRMFRPVREPYKFYTCSKTDPYADFNDINTALSYIHINRGTLAGQTYHLYVDAGIYMIKDIDMWTGGGVTINVHIIGTGSDVNYFQVFNGLSASIFGTTLSMDVINSTSGYGIKIDGVSLAFNNCNLNASGLTTFDSDFSWFNVDYARVYFNTCIVNFQSGPSIAGSGTYKLVSTYDDGGTANVNVSFFNSYAQLLFLQ